MKPRLEEFVEGTCWSCGEETLIEPLLEICEPCTEWDEEETLRYDDNVSG